MNSLLIIIRSMLNVRRPSSRTASGYAVINWMLAVWVLLFVFCAFAGLAQVAPNDMITGSFLQGYDPDTPEGPITREILKLVREEPRLNPQKWGGLTLPGAGGRAPFMLSLAGHSAPDIYYCWFHIIRHAIDQGFDSVTSPCRRCCH